MRHGAFLPPFDELADARLVAGLAAEAEQAGWDGFFVWDHIAYRAPVREVADPWIVLTAVALATQRMLLGPMVTPLNRRRPVVVARQTATLDVLSGGRLVLGVGSGGDGAHELSGTGEVVQGRGALLDEALQVLAQAWSGEPVAHRGEHYVVDLPALLPVPAQRPGPPVWVAARYGNAVPLRRAARHDGVFPIGVDRPEQLVEVLDQVRAQRPAGRRPLDVAVGGPPGTDPAPYGAAGATWWMTSFPITTTARQLREVLREGPPR